MCEWNEMSYRKFSNKTIIERINSEEPDLWEEERKWMDETFSTANIQNIYNKISERKLGTGTDVSKSNSIR